MAARAASGVRRALQGGGETSQGMRRAGVGLDATDYDDSDFAAPAPAMSHTVNLDEQPGMVLTPEMAAANQRDLSLGAPANDTLPPEALEHDANLVAFMTADEVAQLGRDLQEEIDAAEQSRAPWTRLLAEGFRKLGFDRGRDKRNEPFVGASAVVHPAFAQACIEGQARAEAKLAPPEGPCKTQIVGEPSEEADERAERVAAYMNWQCLEQMDEWSEETERLLMMVWQEGSSFKKLWWDGIEMRPRTAYVRSEDVIMPYNASSHMTASPCAERLRIYQNDALGYIRAGVWAEHRTDGSDLEAVSAAQLAADRAVGLEESGNEVDGMKPLIYFETQTRRSLKRFDGGTPTEYLVTLQHGTNTVVAVRRNFSELDVRKKRNRLLQHYRAFPWRGVYGLGLLHLVGGLTVAATGALRALLDSALWVNAPGGFKMGGSRTNGTKITRSPGEYVDYQGPTRIDDIRKAIMADPHPGPSTVLFSLLEFLTTEIKSFASVALAEVAETNANVPVGTTMARLDEASRVYAGVFRRLHRSQKRELQALYALNMATITQQMDFHSFETPEIRPEDFRDGIQIIPVSDPNSHSQIQESLQAQARLTLAREAAADGVQGIDMLNAYKVAGKSMGLHGIDDLFKDPPEPVTADPFTENKALMDAVPAALTPDQSHDLHLEVHLQLMTLPTITATPAGGLCIKHILEHMTAGALMISMTGRMAHDTGDPDAIAAAGDLMDPAAWYGSWMDQLAPLVLPMASPDVAAMVEAEKLKSTLKAQADATKLKLEKEGMIAEAAVETQQMREEFNAKKDAELSAIREKHASAMAVLAGNKAIAAMNNASRERIAAAQIAAKAAEPPKPAGIGAAAKPRRKTASK